MDVDSGEHRVLERYEATLDVAFVAAGAIAFGDRQGEVHVWWTETGDVETLSGHTGAIISVDAAAGLLISGSSDRTVRVWAAPARRRLARLPVPASGYGAFSPDGRWFASGDSLGGVDLVEVGSGELRRLTGHDGPVSGVIFSQDGRQMLSNDEHTARLWDLASGSGHAIAEYPFGWRPAVFTVGTSLLFWGNEDITLWDMAGTTPRCRFAYDDLCYYRFDPHVSYVRGRSVFVVSIADCTAREVFRAKSEIRSFAVPTPPRAWPWPTTIRS